MMRDTLFSCPGLSISSISRLLERPDFRSPLLMTRESPVTSMFPPETTLTTVFPSTGNLWNIAAATAAANKKARQDKLDAEATADKKRDQSYEDELRSLEIQKQKLALAKEEARVKRENEFIDQELKHKAAQTDVVQSEADANRNMTEGGRDLMKSVGKAEENKSDSWFN